MHFYVAYSNNGAALQTLSPMLISTVKNCTVAILKKIKIKSIVNIIFKTREKRLWAYNLSLTTLITN